MNEIKRQDDWDKLLMQEELKSKIRQRVIDQIKESSELNQLLEAIEDITFDVASDLGENDYYSDEDDHISFLGETIDEIIKDKEIDKTNKLPLDYSAEKLIRGLIYKKKDIDKFKTRFNAYNLQLLLESSEQGDKFNNELMNKVNKKTYLINEIKKKNSEKI